MKRFVITTLAALALVIAAAAPSQAANNKDLTNAMAKGAGISKTQATKALNSLIKTITAYLKKGDKVAIKGFGTFSVSQRAARTGRNPQTGATIQISAKKIAKFKAGKDLDSALK